MSEDAKSLMIKKIFGKSALEWSEHNPNKFLSNLLRLLGDGENYESKAQILDGLFLWSDWEGDDDYDFWVDQHAHWEEGFDMDSHEWLPGRKEVLQDAFRRIVAAGAPAPSLEDFL